MRTSAGFKGESLHLVFVGPSLYFAVLKAHATIVPDVKAPGTCETWGVAILLMRAVGFGKIMIAEKDWHGAEPWAGPKAIRYLPHAKVSSFDKSTAMLLEGREGGRWSVVTERAAPANPGLKSVGPTAEWLDDLRAVRWSLSKMRRIFRRKDASGKSPTTCPNRRAA